MARERACVCCVHPCCPLLEGVCVCVWVCVCVCVCVCIHTCPRAAWFSVLAAAAYRLLREAMKSLPGSPACPMGTVLDAQGIVCVLPPPPPEPHSRAPAPRAPVQGASAEEVAERWVYWGQEGVGGG
ncbi:unnamed protein product [Natator depressus]